MWEEPCGVHASCRKGLVPKGDQGSAAGSDRPSWAESRQTCTLQMPQGCCMQHQSTGWRQLARLLLR